MSDLPSSSKKQRIENDSEEDNDERQTDYRKVLLEDMDKIQDRLDVIEDACTDEITKIERKYAQQKASVYVERSTIIKQIRSFWLVVLKNQLDIAEIIDESEEDCLSYLRDVEICDEENFGYSIHFHFDPNPYFNNTVLTKTLLFNKLDSTDSTNSTILWKHGKQLGTEEKTFFHWYQTSVNSKDDDIAETIKDDIYLNPLMYYLVNDNEDSTSNSSSE